MGSSKSEVAATAIKAINPHMNVYSTVNKLSEETENIFDSSFWEEADVVVTALVDSCFAVL